MFKKIVEKLALPAALLLAAAPLAACSQSSETAGEDPSATTTAASTEGTLTVFAAASLNKAFTAIADEVFATTNPGVEVKFSFEGSSTLVDQIQNGSPADVFASADLKNMDKATEAGLVQTPVEFTRNDLTLIVPAGNPAGITGIDSSLEGSDLIVCAPQVPCGNLTLQVAKDAGVELKPVSEEQKVTDVRGKIESGQGDAGFVYATDAKAAGDKVEVIPMSVKGTNTYPIAVVKDSANAQTAQAFIDAVLSDEGQTILARFGFLALK
ncbi:MAG: molybdate ABC transporter substrate-binding protein [Actinomycetaceae bacterium]|nr:molybdate ABC transporter substrate-binding protein [Actinomycetaceae bacterium]